MTNQIEIPCLSALLEIEAATRLLIAKRGINGCASFLKELANMDLFFTKNKADTKERAIHKFILAELVKIYQFKDSDYLLNGVSHRQTMARLIGIYLLRENTNLSYASISILYRKSDSRTRAIYKQMDGLKSGKGNTQFIINFNKVKSSLKIYRKYLTDYEQL